MADRPFIYCFAKDLRLDDHAGLAAAASHGMVIPMLVIDSAMADRLAASPRRAAFFCGAVNALDAELRERGSRLIVRRGSIEKHLLDVALQTDAAGAAWSASYDRGGMQRDDKVQSALEERGLSATIVHDRPAIAPEETAALHTGQGPGYRAFAPYFEVWCTLRPASYEQPLLLGFTRADVAAEPPPQAREFGATDNVSRAGSAAARRRFEKFLREHAPVYATESNVPAEDGTSCLSADLSFGTISARAVVRAVRERLDDPFSISEQRLSLRAYLRALAHRDFFLQLSWFNPQTADEPLQSKMREFRFAQSHVALDAWRAGRTGYLLVDAGVRQLHETGWMHPHVRAVAASVLCFDLGVDWRVGRDEWDRWLIEDDSPLATGNWQWIAGVGADMAQYPRIYNPERQRRRYDPSGAYVRRWVKELAHIPVEAWYGRTLDSPQLSLALFDHVAYPQPVVDHAATARAFLRRYSEFVARSSEAP
jgi:deoxyribodipyrimidine photo-lyase